MINDERDLHDENYNFGILLVITILDDLTLERKCISNLKVLPSLYGSIKINLI